MQLVKQGNVFKAIKQGTKFFAFELGRAIKTLFASGTPPLTFENSTGGSLVNYKIYGNSEQDGTPTIATPVEIESVGNKSPNILNPDFELTETGGYRFATLEGKTRTLTISITDRDTSVDLSGISFGFSGTGNNSQGGYNWIVSNGRVQKTQTTNIVSNKDEPVETPYMFFSVYPNTEDVWNRVFSRFYIQIEDGETPTEYKPFGYEIPVKVGGDTATGYEPTTTSIYLDEPLRKIGTYNADYIDFANKKVVRNINQITYTGEETFIDFDSNVFTTTTITKGLTASNDILVCNTCTPSRTTTLGWRNNSVSSLQINKSWIGATTIDELKTVLQGLSEQLKIYYVLATPTEETIELPQIQTSEGTNILDVNTAIKPSNIEITYKGK